MSDEKRLLEKLSERNLCVLFLSVTVASTTIVLIFIAGLGFLVLQGKISATFSDIFSLILGIIAILATIVFSRLSTDIRQARERIQELVTSEQRNAEHLSEIFRSSVEKIESGNTLTQQGLLAGIRSEIQDLREVVIELNRSTEFEKMLKSMSQRSDLSTEVLVAKDKNNKLDERNGVEHLASQAAKVLSQLSFEELTVLHIFAEANESVLSHDLFERYVTRKNLSETMLRKMLDKLRLHECLAIYSTALSLTNLGKAVVAKSHQGVMSEPKKP
ncbi:MAG: hypothetical protein A2505_11105 [Deltaproteobacteria bacterium RIFOXYD12_FULL_55_16]|nr:MAG: hypothetical protein A2505_11105 [Deltaproteobacteria bacterium RIFOXYD12_FULL_55_16]